MSCQAPDTLVGKRDKALLATLATSGLRASELANLIIGQIHPRSKGYYLQVIGKMDTELRDAHLSADKGSSQLDVQTAYGRSSLSVLSRFIKQSSKIEIIP